MANRFKQGCQSSNIESAAVWTRSLRSKSNRLGFSAAFKKKKGEPRVFIPPPFPHSPSKARSTDLHVTRMLVESRDVCHLG